MTSEQRLLKRLRTAEDIHAELDKLEAEIRAKVKRKNGKAGLAPGRSREDRRREKSTTNREVYADVKDRDAGLCTVQLAAMGKCSGALHMDHQWGRGKEPTTVENCRMLCARHDRMKTENETDDGHSRLLWLCDYREHALSHDYYAEVAKADAQIALERAQHPEAA